jgi:tetratricopeptide (TPR) repeat protein
VRGGPDRAEARCGERFPQEIPMSHRVRPGRSLAVLATVGAFAAAVPVQAQPGGVQAQCSIDQNAPKELSMIELRMARLAAAKDSATKNATLREAMKLLTEKPQAFAKNQAGMHYAMARVIGSFMSPPEPVGSWVPRAQLGYVSNPTGMVDPAAALDTSLAEVVKAAPGCASEFVQFREGLLWFAYIQRAQSFLGQGNADSAAYYSEKSTKENPKSPFGFYFLGQIADNKNETAAAVENWGKAINAAGNDSSYRDLKNGAMLMMGVRSVEQAQGLQGDEQKAAAKRGQAPLEMFLEANPTATDAPTAMQSLADAYQMAGDSAKVPGIYAALLADAGTASDFSYTTGGVLAARVEKWADAAKLFEKALAINPYQRDALNNVIASYNNLKEPEKMRPVIDRLVAIDPSNPDAVQYYALMAQTKRDQVKLPAEKKAWADTLTKYYTASEKMPVKVTITNFTRGQNSASVGASIEHRGATPGTYTFTVEFLDKSGAVVGTGSAEPVTIAAKGERKAVTVKADVAGVTAFRYKKLGS